MNRSERNRIDRQIHILDGLLHWLRALRRHRMGMGVSCSLSTSLAKLGCEVFGSRYDAICVQHSSTLLELSV